MSVLVIGSVALMWFGESLARGLFTVMSRLFSLSREEIYDFGKLIEIIFGAMVYLILPLLLILVTLFVAALAGAAGVGDQLFC